MANLSLIEYLPNRVAEHYHLLRKLTSKLHKTSASIGFLQTALYQRVTPNFVKIKGQFIDKRLKEETERKLTVEHLKKHFNDLQIIRRDYDRSILRLKQICGSIFCQALLINIRQSLHKERLESFRTKNKKLKVLISSKTKTLNVNYCVPIVNLSETVLTHQEQQQLSFGLDHSFIDKNKHIKKVLAANLETVADKITETLTKDNRENFHEYLRAYTDIFTKNVYNTKDFTYQNLKNLVNNKDVVIVPGDKDSAIIVMNRPDYIKKMQEMIDDGIAKNVYTPTTDTTLKDLRTFKDFLYRNFKNHGKYDKMVPQSNQPARLYGTAKTHKFSSFDEITVESIKFRPIIAQTGTYTYKTAQVISDYLKPLCSSNPHIIRNTQDFPTLLKEQPMLANNEEYVSYDVESLFTNIPIKETINYILHEIYENHKLVPICSKLIFKRLLLKLTTESTFIFNSKWYKQTDGCTMGGPLSVTFSDIFMTKLELEALQPPRERSFYKRYVDDIITKRNKEVPDNLFEYLNNYHERIKLTLEVNPTRFLDTKIILSEQECKTEVFRKENKITPHWSTSVPKRFKRNAINGDLSRADRISSDFKKEKQRIWSKYEKADYPPAFVKSVYRSYNEKKIANGLQEEEEEELLIPKNFFELPKHLIVIEIPYCPDNEQISKHFIKKFHDFTNDQYRVNIKWITKKVKALFTLKDRNPYPACKVYEGTCICGSTYVGETVRNVVTRWEEHENTRKDSEPAKHIKNNPGHYFNWKTLMHASTNYRDRKNLEASIIATKGPNLNNQIETKKLLLFRNGVT